MKELLAYPQRDRMPCLLLYENRHGQNEEDSHITWRLRSFRFLLDGGPR